MTNKNPLLIFFLFLFSGAAFAQQVSLISDLPTDVANLNTIRAAGGKLYYSDATRLWVTDGLPGSTPLLLLTATNNGIDRLTSFNNKLYFVSKDALHGSELWCSDGTVAGTHLLKDIVPGPTSFFSTPGAIGSYRSDTLEYYNGKLSFIQKDTVGHVVIYTYNGTDTGLVYQRSLFPTITDLYNAKFTNDNKLYISGTDTFGNSGLFVMHGLQDSAEVILPGYYAINFMELGSRVFFTGATFTSNHLFYSDGTATFTQDLNYDMGPTDKVDFTTLNNELYFYHEYRAVGATSINKIVKTDGTPSNTMVLKQGFTLNNSIFGKLLTRKSAGLTAFNNKVYFSIVDSTVPGLWQTDGTNSGTISFLKTFMQPTNLTVYSHDLYFQYLDTTRFTLGKTDGTVAGTTKVADTLSRFPVGSGGLIQAVAYQNPVIELYNGSMYYTSNKDVIAGKNLYRLQYFPTGIQNANTEKAIMLYPNPANDKITIDAKGFKALELTSVDGKMLLHSDMNLADVSALPNGIYIVTVFTTSGILKDKLLIAR